MRPINSMIEFKQIIGRGTRLYDGKDYFTIYDFVKAHHHFSDPEWDGEPIEPEPEGRTPRPPRRTRPSHRGRDPNRRPRPQKIKVKLADGKARTIQHMMARPSGIPTARPCRRSSSWRCCSASCRSSSRTRPSCAPSGAPRHPRKAAARTRRKGLWHEQMAEMQKIIDAEKSDLFDVLAHVAYALPPLTREERAARAKVAISTQFNSKQQVFLDFRAGALCQSWRGGTGPGEADAAAAAQVPQRHRRCRCRPRTTGGDRERLRGLPEVSVSRRGIIPYRSIVALPARRRPRAA